ncbi:MAG: hypothetical protein Q7J19_06390 [Lutibacter sp.]|nr:hypothetical protein [Lutibacter sp.]
MMLLKKSFNRDFLKILGLFLVLMLLQSCSTYKKSTNLEEASRAEQEGVVKVTMTNGDQYIYESIELKENTYYGIKTIEGGKTQTVLLKEDVMKVERQNKNSSGFFGITGIAIGIASIVLAVLMF